MTDSTWTSFRHGRSVFRRQPKLVVLAQAIVIPVGFVFFTALGTWWLIRGNGRGAAVAFAVAALGPASIIVYYVLYYFGVRAARRRSVRHVLSLQTDGVTALQSATEVLRWLAGEVEPEVSLDQARVFVLMPPTSTTFGERVHIVVDSRERESRLEITSYSVGPQLLDHGKNRANVEAIVRKLTSPDG